MSAVLPKSEMSEEDVKLQYITPAITSKWDRGKITMETQVTDGKINLKGNLNGRCRCCWIKAISGKWIKMKTEYSNR